MSNGTLSRLASWSWARSSSEGGAERRELGSWIRSRKAVAADLERRERVVEVEKTLAVSGGTSAIAVAC